MGALFLETDEPQKEMSQPVEQHYQTIATKAYIPGSKSTQELRQRFEQWADGVGFSTEREFEGDYFAYGTSVCWRAWENIFINTDLEKFEE